MRFRIIPMYQTMVPERSGRRLRCTNITKSSCRSQVNKLIVDMDYQSVCTKVVDIAIETGNFIHGRIRSISTDEIEVKGRHNFVTEVDKAAEVMIVNRLSDLVSGAGFIAEEGTAPTRGERYNWVIDPLDGTTNFIHGTPPVAVSIALIEDEKPVLGVIYEIWMKEAFYAWKGGPAFLNGNPIRVSETAKVTDSLIATGFPYQNFDRIEGFMDTIQYFFTNTHGVRRLGSAATDLAYVACGRYDGFYEYNLNPWDVAAGIIIVAQAGGKVTDFKGGNDYLFGREIVASNGTMHAEFQHDVARLMKP
jgi:myo-inositol-1(or 4)-monophosphatase